VGGQAWGSFDGDRMVGFLLAIPGLKPSGGSYLHSHMMGVLPEYRNAGLGREMKLRQREVSLAGHVKLIEWTFDPLEIKNAFFNIERLGAVVRRYVLNQYGITTSHLHGSLPTDRCVAEWWIGMERTDAILGRRAVDRPPVAARVSVPADIARIRHEEPRRAVEIQTGISERFLENFRNGLAVTGFESTSESGTYLFTEGFEVPTL
jgi:predicted GNAT superfamily acetyltransferase